MIYTKKFLESSFAKKLPAFIIEHKAFKDNKKIVKIFPRLGLKNNIEECDGNVFNEAGCKLHVRFSSDKINGLWDIATMSMRGIFSCMDWSTYHARHLVGSMLDPFTGIIYLTDKTKSDLGYIMYKRSVVRFMLTNNNAPFIFIERSYKNSNLRSYDSNRDNKENETFSIFSEYLIKHMKRKLPVFSYYNIPEHMRTSVYVPRHKSLDNMTQEYSPFSDSQYPYCVYADGRMRTADTIMDKFR